jgi:hypothetical protein
MVALAAVASAAAVEARGGSAEPGALAARFYHSGRRASASLPRRPWVPCAPPHAAHRDHQVCQLSIAAPRALTTTAAADNDTTHHSHCGHSTISAAERELKSKLRAYKKQRPGETMQVRARLAQRHLTSAMPCTCRRRSPAAVPPAPAADHAAAEREARRAARPNRLPDQPNWRPPGDGEERDGAGAQNLQPLFPGAQPMELERQVLQRQQQRRRRWRLHLGAVQGVRCCFAPG